MKQNVKKPNRRDAKKIAKQLEEKKFKEPGKDDMKEFIAEVNKQDFYLPTSTSTDTCQKLSTLVELFLTKSDNLRDDIF